MSLTSRHEKWKRCFGNNSFIATINSVENVDELFDFVTHSKPDLQQLIVSMIQADHIPGLSGITMLTFIDFSFNTIKDVSPLLECPLLQTLVLSHNNIENIISLTSLNALNALDISFNSITEITTPPHLGSLKASNNPLVHLNINSSLRLLTIDDCPLKKLKLSLNSLDIISVSRCSFDSFKLKCENLKSIVADSTQFNNQVIVQLPQLFNLSMNQSALDSIVKMLSQITTLTSITLGRCKLKEIPQEIYTQTNLARLVLFNNPITKISEEITSLIHLTYIDMLDCLVEDCPSLTNLNQLEQFMASYDEVITTSKYYESKLPKQCQFIGRDYGKFDKIIDSLFLGSYANAHNKSYLQEMKITHILTIGPLQPIFPELFVYKQINIDDSVKEDISVYFEECYQFIDQARNSSGAVLVHCAAGISRSASIVIAYLMKKNKWTYEQSYSYTLKCRPIICPNSSFVEQLKGYEEKVLIKKCSIV
ncbi:internalin-A precursor, putative [Entamoeba dispar SAW760]|uniref:Internalin-A, putative n=1 Tax=Entamoeba dispar (strain ATCC PRA-260 / SAW760) TaxID=370354 RepID=B0EMU4_ENTDS|nr:internalin-A precursor, putative [Entamoeba dispar SAW760]EDR24169.1 internalin-A precursor, putative [Entamoeba dispar SAW760]|eukprot:EDR24169.1 internalin-A precursor, putative [Entamoeba dispar SAW760]